MELSFKRLCLLIKKQFIENQKLYLFGVLAIMGIMAFVFLSGTASSNGFEIVDQGVFFWIGMISFGCLFTLTLFAKVGLPKEKQIFTIPVSLSEKLICAIIYGTILFPLLYIITVYPLLRLASYLDNSYMGHINKTYLFDVAKIQPSLITMFYVLQALVLLLSVFFKEHKIIKSVVLICSLFFGSIFFYPKIISQFLPTSFQKEIEVNTRVFQDGKPTKSETQKVDEWLTSNDSYSPFSEGRYFSNTRQVSIDVPFEQKKWFYILVYISIPFMWFITWVRLKEWEAN